MAGRELFVHKVSALDIKRLCGPLRGNRDLRQELEKNDRLRRREWEGGLDLRDGRREKKEV